MTRAISYAWAKLSDRVDQKKPNLKKTGHPFAREHEFEVSVFGDKSRLAEAFENYNQSYRLLTHDTEYITYPDADAGIIAVDREDEPYGFGHVRMKSRIPEEMRYLWGFTKENIHHFDAPSAIVWKTFTPSDDSDIVLSARSPVAGRSPQARLTGPIRFLGELIKTWGLTQADATILLGLEVTDQAYVNNLLRGHVRLRGRDTKDRIAYLFRIRKTLSALFRNEDVENKWLRDHHDLLDKQAPMTLLLEGSMENILLVKEYVEAAAGR